MRILLSIAGIAMLAAPLALAQPAPDFTVLRKELKDGAIEGTIQNHTAEGVVAKGATVAHEFAVDPNRDTIIIAFCDAAACSEINVVGSDSTGAFITPDRISGREGIATMFADSIKSGKLKVDVSTPGCRTDSCAYVLSVSSRPRSYPAE